MYFNHIKYILIDLKLIKTDLLLNQSLKYLIICVGSILGQNITQLSMRIAQAMQFGTLLVILSIFI